MNKKIIFPACIIFLLLTLPTMLFAEYIFLKDGSIIEGKVVQDTDTAVTILIEKGQRKTFPRKDVLRVIYLNEFKKKSIVRLTNGEEIECYVVFEDRDSYIIRKRLNSTEERIIPRDKIIYVAKKVLAELKGNPDERSIELTWAPPIGVIKNYQVFIKQKGLKGAEYTLSGEPVRNEFTIKNLNEQTTYLISVAFVDEDGYKGVSLNELTITTLKKGEKPIITKKDEKQTTVQTKKTRAGMPPSGSVTGVGIRFDYLFLRNNIKKYFNNGVGGIFSVDFYRLGGSGVFISLETGIDVLSPKSDTTINGFLMSGMISLIKMKQSFNIPLLLGLGYEIYALPQLSLAFSIHAGVTFLIKNYYSNVINIQAISTPTKKSKKDYLLTLPIRPGFYVIGYPLTKLSIFAGGAYEMAYDWSSKKLGNKTLWYHSIVINAGVRFLF